MSKWIIKACEPGQSNLHTLLRFRLMGYQPFSRGNWSPSMEFFTISGHQRKKGSTAWTRATKAWKATRKDLASVKPQSQEEVLNESFWWSQFCPAIGPAFSKIRAASLHRVGLRRISNAWANGSFLRMDEASRRFGLEPHEQQAWGAVTSMLTRYWGGLLHDDNWSSSGEWLGVFRPQDPHPDFVFQSPGGRNWQVGLNSQHFHLLLDCPLFTMLKAACCLSQVSDDLRLDQATINLMEPETRLSGVLHRVRVVSVTRGPRKVITHLFYGKIALLDWDPNRFAWPGNTSFMQYTSKLGREWLSNTHVLPDVVAKKWQGILLGRFRLRWASIWDKQRVRKEAGLLWRLWHRAVEVNAWRGVINIAIVQDCAVCRIGARETALHCFSECGMAKQAWARGFRIVQALADGPRQHRCWAPINWQQSIFSYRVPRRFCQVGRF